MDAASERLCLVCRHPPPTRVKTLTTPVSTAVNAEQSGWADIYDIYLKAAIVTPWGTVDTIRLTTLPEGLPFFAPKQWPEPDGNRGNAADYQYWNLKRSEVSAESKFT